MTERCDLCDRGMAEKQHTPYWWPHGPVCQRRACVEAVRDAVRAIEKARDRFDGIPRRVAIEAHENTHPVGYRQDAFAATDLDDGEWWATEVTRTV
jgi:hypothetical protein